jgi:hypothetical protein
MVDQLEDQYMLKLLRMDYRVQMRTVAQVAEPPGIDVTGVRCGDGRSRTVRNKLLDDLATLVTSLTAITSDRERLPYRHTLLSLPIRSILQLLRVYYSVLMPNDQPSASGTAATVRSLVDISRSSLRAIGIEPDELQAAQPLELYQLMLEWLNKDPRRWLEYSSWVPDFIDAESNIASVAILALLLQSFRIERGRIFDYMIKFCVTADRCLQLSYRGSRTLAGDDISRSNNGEGLGTAEHKTGSYVTGQDEFNEYCRFVRLEYAESGATTARRICGWETERVVHTESDSGLINPFSMLMLPQSVLGGVYEVDLPYRAMAGFSASREIFTYCSEKIPAGNSMNCWTFSFIQVIGLMSDVFLESLPDENIEASNVVGELMYNRFMPEPFRSPLSYGSGRQNSVTSSEVFPDISRSAIRAASNTHGQTLKSLRDSLVLWQRKWADADTAIPPISLSNIWKTFNEIVQVLNDSIVGGASKDLGEKCHALVLAFMASVCLECVRPLSGRAWRRDIQSLYDLERFMHLLLSEEPINLDQRGDAYANILKLVLSFPVWMAFLDPAAERSYRTLIVNGIAKRSVEFTGDSGQIFETRWHERGSRRKITVKHSPNLYRLLNRVTEAQHLRTESREPD